MDDGFLQDFGAPGGNDSLIAQRAPAGLERSCSIPAQPRIRTGAASRGIERIEASFHGDGFAPHRHDTYALGLTLSGVQTFDYRGESRFSRPGNVIVLHPDERHDGAAGTDDGLLYRMLYLPPDLLQCAGGRSGGALPFVPQPVLQDAALAAALGEALLDFDHAPETLALDDLLGRLSDGLWLNADDRASPLKPSTRQALWTCRDHLYDNCSKAINSQDLEAISGLDRYSLARQFRALFGTSPHRYLIMRRLDRARADLSRGADLATAAAGAGFADQSHFNRHFKKTYGMTPGRWLARTRA
ncbi:MAG: AraC family transcriptional regulator [Allorhizobium sp.]